MSTDPRCGLNDSDYPSSIPVLEDVTIDRKFGEFPEMGVEVGERVYVKGVSDALKSQTHQRT